MKSETANRIRKMILKEYITDQITEEEAASLLYALDQTSKTSITKQDLDRIANDAGVIRAYEYQQLKQQKGA